MIKISEIIKTTLLGLFFGTIGTTLGGIIGAKSNITSNRFLSFILEFAAGLMMAIVCFELIPESLELTNIANVFLGIILGVITMIWCDNIINKKYMEKYMEKNIKNNNTLLKTGIIVGIGLAIHNFPEGLAIGSGFEASTKLGITLAIAILLHDIPEGIFQGRQHNIMLEK